MADSSTAPAAAAADNKRWTYGLLAVLGGLVVILVAAFVAIGHFHSSSDVVAVISAVAAPVGTIVAAYFGVAAGSDGKARADANAAAARSEAQKAHEAVARAVAPLAPPEAQALIDRVYGTPTPDTSSGSG